MVDVRVGPMAEEKVATWGDWTAVWWVARWDRSMGGK
jgi:hypothetical protein